MAQPRKIGVRGQPAKATLTMMRGQEAEGYAAEFFRRRGHQVTDVSEKRVMHDLEVTGYGRVQVKRAWLVDKHRKMVFTKRKAHRDNYGSTCYRIKLASGNTGHRYPANAWDWLCAVFVLDSGPRFILLRAAACLVPGMDYMVAVIHYTKHGAAMRWEALEPAKSMWEEGVLSHDA